MSEPADNATAQLGSAMLRTLAPLLSSLGGGLAGQAVSEAADFIDEQADEISALRSELAILRMAHDMNAAQRDIALAFADEVRAALGDGADEHAWPPGKTAPEAIATLRAGLAEAHASMITHDTIEAGCRNIGHDMTCGACAEIFWTGSTLASHTCKAPPAQAIIVQYGVGMVTIEEHARAVREALMDSASPDMSDGFLWDLWQGSEPRRDLIVTLTTSGVPEARAVALADGADV